MNTETLLKFKKISNFSKELKLDPWREIPESFLTEFQELSTVQKRNCNDFYQMNKDHIIFNIIENVTLYRNYYNLNILEFLLKNEIKMNKHDTSRLNQLEKTINEKPKFIEFFQLFPIHYEHNVGDNLKSVKNIINKHSKKNEIKKSIL